MALAKKIFIYIAGIVALGLVAVIAFAGYLVVIPGSEIFGYHYLSGKAFAVVEEHVESEALANYENLEVETGGFNLVLEPQNDKMDRIMVEFLANANGFTKEDVHEFSYTYSYDSDTQTILFKVNQPTKGIMFYNDAYIKIGMPDIVREVYLDINSKGGSIVLGQPTPFGSLEPLVLETSAIKIKNTRAAMTLQNFTMSNTGTLDITNKSGRTKILSEVGSYSQKAGDVIIKSEIGSFTFGTEDEVYNIGGNLTIVTDNSFVKAGNIGGHVSQTSDSGLVNLLTVNGDLVIDTKSSETKVQKVLGTVTIESEYNTIEIGQIGEEVNQQYRARIILLNGNIIIDTCYYDLEVVSARGNVTVNKVFSDVDIQTTYGDVVLTYDASTSAVKEVIDEQDVFKSLSIVTTQGNITAKNIKAETNLQVGASSTATITAEFLEVNGENFIQAGRREFTVLVPIASFNYEVITSSGGINILVGSESKNSWSSEDYNSTTKKYSTGLQAVDGNVGTNTDVIIISSSAGKINFVNQ